MIGQPLASLERVPGGRQGTYLVHPDLPPGSVTDSEVTLNVNDAFVVRAGANNPRELPTLRSELVNAWASSGVFTQGLKGDSQNEGGLFQRTRSEWEHQAAIDAHLLWVADDLTDVIDDLRPTLPGSTTLEHEDVPWPAGIAVFAHSLQGTASIGDYAGQPLAVRAIVWSPINLRPMPGSSEWRSGIGISSYQLCDFDEGLDELGVLAAHDVIIGVLRSSSIQPTLEQSIRLIGKAWLPLGRSDWVWGESVDTHLPDDLTTLEMQASFEEDRRLVYTLWRLMKEEQIVESSEFSRSKKAAKKRRAGRRDQPVTVIHLRRPTIAGEPTEGDSGRSLSVRFMVRPHWRQQAYGPGRSLRRPILVPPHWKGPDGAPVKVTEKVWTLDR